MLLPEQMNLNRKRKNTKHKEIKVEAHLPAKELDRHGFERGDKTNWPTLICTIGDLITPFHQPACKEELLHCYPHPPKFYQIIQLIQITPNGFGRSRFDTTIQFGTLVQLGNH